MVVSRLAVSASLCSTSNGGWTSNEPLLPEFPFRLQFAVDIHTELTRARRTQIPGAKAAPKVSVEVAVHNVKNPQADEIIGTPSLTGYLSSRRHGVIDLNSVRALGVLLLTRDRARVFNDHVQRRQQRQVD